MKVLAGVLGGSMVAGPVLARLRPVPGRLVVLTLNDAALTYATYVALLRRYGFGLPFFVCEFPQPPCADKSLCMSWAQIRQLPCWGFEMGSPPLTHQYVNELTDSELTAKLDAVEQRCRTHHNPRLVTFAYPGYDTAAHTRPGRRTRGYRLARVGANRPYNPAHNGPLRVPGYATLATNRPDIRAALTKAPDGRVTLLRMSGVPSMAPDRVSTLPARFAEYPPWHRYRVVALRRRVRASPGLSAAAP